MNTLKIIEDFIINNDIENAYDTIMQNEKDYIKSAEYWNLRGMLCFKIQEYNVAIGCYKTSIALKNNYTDAYFNLIFAYMVIGEKLKSALYGGISLRYIDDEDYGKDIENLYINEKCSDKYYEFVQEVNVNTLIYGNELDFVKYIGSQFHNVNKGYIDTLSKNKIFDNWSYVKKDTIITMKEISSIDEFINRKDIDLFNVIVPYDVNYVEVTRNLAFNGFRKCFVLAETGNEFELIDINEDIMSSLRKEEYKRTVSMNKFNAADSNITALIKYMPEKYKDKYKINVIDGRDVFETSNIVKVPLISSVTVSGFNTFVNYPKFTYNIDVGHGEVAFKACGLMDKKDKNFAYTPEEYENIDKVCASSKMSTVIKSAFSAIPEDKYEITGSPRTDSLCLTDGRKNLEKLLDIKLQEKKIIFNMPTFHTHENSGLVNGSKELNDSIKIKDFDYNDFDKFLGENNLLCISKVHHAEERTVTNRTKDRKLKNMIFISNYDLDRYELDLYEILNGADLLLTDYSSVYGDFLFMDKPTLFIDTDLEEYRNERGIMLEPYDFWAAGPKVQCEEKLKSEILKCLNDENYYKKERETIKDIFYYYKDNKASLRVWDIIADILR